MHDLEVALRSEAKLAGKMPQIIQLAIDQHDWIRENLSSGHVPGAMDNCHCSVCENAHAGYKLLREFEKMKLTDRRPTL